MVGRQLEDESSDQESAEQVGKCEKNQDAKVLPIEKANAPNVDECPCRCAKSVHIFGLH